MTEKIVDFSKYNIDFEKSFFIQERPIAIKSNSYDYNENGNCVYTEIETGNELSLEDINMGGYLVISKSWRGIYFAFDDDSSCTVVTYLCVEDDGMLLEFLREYVLSDGNIIQGDEDSDLKMLNNSEEMLLFNNTDSFELLNWDMEYVNKCFSSTFNCECDIESINQIPFFIRMAGNSRDGLKPLEKPVLYENMLIENIPAYDESKDDFPVISNTFRGQVLRTDEGVFFTTYYFYNNLASLALPYASFFFPIDGSMKCIPLFVGNLSFLSYDFTVSGLTEEVIKDTRLEWYIDIVNKFPAKIQGKALFNLANFPSTESLMKSVFMPIFTHYFESEYYCYVDESMLNSMFRFTIDDRRYYEIYKALHIGKKQAEIMMKHFKKYQWENIASLTSNNGFFNFPANLIWIDGMLCRKSKIGLKDDIYKKVSPKLLDNLYTFIFDVIGPYDNQMQKLPVAERIVVFDVMRLLAIMFSIEKMLTLKDFFIMLQESKEGFNVYYDYLNMAKEIGMHELAISFTTIEELKEEHDNITYLYNVTKNPTGKEARNNFINNCNKLNNFIYEDDNYIISIPKTPEDLIKEGSLLNHCVKSYIKRVAAGSSIILFLREKDKPDKPFFTIELAQINDDNDLYIRQVHGQNNCNIETIPEAEHFLKRWLMAKSIYIQNGGYNDCL